MKYYLTLAAGLAGLAALPAAAQDTPSCGGIAATWLGGDAADIGSAADPQRQEASASASNRPWLAFRLEGAAQDMRIEAQAIGDGDPMLVLAQSDGTSIAENDDVAGSLDSRIEARLEPGDYCVQLSSVGGGDLRATVQVGRAEQPGLLPPAPETVDIAAMACTAETEARPLTDGTLEAALSQGRVEAQTEPKAEYLRFRLDQPQSLTLRAVSDGLDPYLKLFDGTGRMIAENDDADGLNSRLDFMTPLEAGDYCIGVAPLSGRPGSITVSAETLDRETFLRSAWRKGEMPPPFDGAYPMQELDLARDRETVVLHDGAAQWLTFTLERPSVLVVDAMGESVGVDSKLALFGATGRLEAENDDANGSIDAQLGPVRLEPGRYRLAVMDVRRMDQTAAPIRPIGLIFDRFERVE